MLLVYQNWLTGGQRNLLQDYPEQGNLHSISSRDHQWLGFSSCLDFSALRA